MADATPSWFDDEPDRPRRLPSRRVVVTLVAATTPWLVLAVLLVRGTATETPTASSPADTPQPTGVAEDRAPDEREEPDAIAAEPVTEPAAEDQEVGDPEATSAEIGDASAVATAVVRAWLSDAAPDLEVSGVEPDRRAYLEHATLQRIEVPGPDAAVATMSVVLLVRDEDRYVDTVVRRVAVPLTVSATAVQPAGPPWWLPDETDLGPAAPQLAPLDDVAVTEAAQEGLVRAGYEDVTVHGVEQGQGDLVVAAVEATTPWGDAVDGPVWLVGGPRSLTVLGAAPQAPSDAADDVAAEDEPEQETRP